MALSAGEERWKARGYAATLVTLSLATTLMLVRISYVQRSLETAASEKDKGKWAGRCMSVHK